MVERCVHLLVALAVSCMGCGIASAQSNAAVPVLEAYLKELGLDALLADHLLGEAASTDPATAVPAARRLAQVYTRMLERTPLQETAPLLTAVEAFVDQYPDAVTLDLRLVLATAEFRRLEPAAERARLGLVHNADIAELSSGVADVAQTLSQLAAPLRARAAEAERRGRSTPSSRVADSLEGDRAEARRRVSACEYYAGWAHLHHATLTGTAASAARATEHFAAVLDLEGEEPILERLPRSLLRYDHVARAALGVGLSHGLRGDRETAIIWLRTLLDSELLSPSVEQQVRIRLVEQLLTSRRWTEADHELIRLRSSARGTLHPADARLVAFVTMGEMADPDVAGRPREIAREVATEALGDLVARGEIGQVLDLFRRFGPLPGLGDGFVGLYVSGIEQYDRAREAQRAAGEVAGQPSRLPHIVAIFDEAARTLGRAVSANDASLLPRERTACRELRGRALLAAGRLVAAGGVFAEAAAKAVDRERREETLWMSVVAYDAAVAAGDGTAQGQRDAQATLYLAGNPRADRAGALAMRMADDGTLGAGAAIAVLRDVPTDAPIGGAARRLLATLLFKEARDAVDVARTPLADEFFAISAELNREDEPAARAGDEAAAAALVLRLRQAAELAFLLSPRRPDVAADAMAQLRRLARGGVVSLQGIEAELAYRDLRVAIAERDMAAEDEALDTLRTIGGPFAAAGLRQAYASAYERWHSDQAEGNLASRVVRLGTFVIEQEEPSTAWSASVRERVAEAAASLWRTKGDTAMRDTAIRLDRDSIKLETATVSALRRLGRLAGERGDAAVALDAWIRCMRAVPGGTDEWFEARYESIAILADVDTERAAASLRQLATLYPTLGGSPWRERFLPLCDRLGVPVQREAP